MNITLDYFRRTVIGILASLFLISVFWGVWIHVSYALSMPRQPDPFAGRTYEITVNHGTVVYVTAREFSRAQFVFHTVFDVGLGAFADSASLEILVKPPAE